MKKIALILTLIGVTLFSVGCTKSPETPANSIDNNTTVEVKKLKTSKYSTSESITMLSDITGTKLTKSEQRDLYTSFDAVNNTYPVTIKGVNIQSFDRSLNYDVINHKIACKRTKDVIITSGNEIKRFRVCQTTNYDWIVK